MSCRARVAGQPRLALSDRPAVGKLPATPAVSHGRGRAARRTVPRAMIGGGQPGPSAALCPHRSGPGTAASAMPLATCSQRTPTSLSGHLAITAPAAAAAVAIIIHGVEVAQFRRGLTPECSCHSSCHRGGRGVLHDIAALAARSHPVPGLPADVSCPVVQSSSSRKRSGACDAGVGPKRRGCPGHDMLLPFPSPGLLPQGA